MIGVVVQMNISNGGVPKQPIETANVNRLGIAGDKHVYRLHGGPEKALLLMSAELIDTLATEGFPVYYGALGENLTIQGLLHTEWRAGQKFSVGTTLIQLTEPRVPCKTLNPFGTGIQKRIFDAKVKAGNPASPHWGESGFYAAVRKEGIIQIGDRLELIP